MGDDSYNEGGISNQMKWRAKNESIWRLVGFLQVAKA